MNVMPDRSQQLRMIQSMLHSWLTMPFFFFFFLRHSSAYTWNFTSLPQQCQNVSIAIQGSGQPPYSLLLIPSGPQLPIEVRSVQNFPFAGTSMSLTFNLNYPEGSAFVAVVCLYQSLSLRSPSVLESLAYRLPHYPQVSDSSGFGTGGTSASITVLPSSDSSCYDPTEPFQLPFYFYLAGAVTQCGSVQWSWYPGSVVGCVLHLSTVSP
jgi:hypothetical protein